MRHGILQKFFDMLLSRGESGITKQVYLICSTRRLTRLKGSLMTCRG